MNPRPQPQPNRRGFTLMELLVAMSLVLLLLFLTNNLFLTTNEVVTRGIQNNKVLATARVINEQITQDTDAMLGPAALPETGGYIVIIQRKLTNVPILDPETQAEVNVGEVRSDQLVFVRSGDGLRSMTPQDANSFGSNLTGDGTFARVYYGHALRTKPDGTRPAGTYTGLDRIASNWIFARQPLLFRPAGLNTSTDTHANSVNAQTNTFLQSGATDITSKPYAPDSASAVTSLLEDLDTAANSSAYYNTSFFNFNNPLYVNPSPTASGTNFDALEIAKAHPILAQGCSEIIIDFAADTNGNGRVDTTAGNGADDQGAIRWYDAIKTRNPDPPSWIAQPGIAQPLVTDQGFTGSSPLRAFVFRIDDDLSFEDAGGDIGIANTPHSYWPYMIRIRYRLHDMRGRLTSNNAAALSDGIDNDGDGTIDNTGEDQASGRWFERIIKVPRP